MKDLEEKEKAEDKRKADAANAPKEVTVQRGVSEDNPVTLDEKANEGGNVPVEKGLPPEAQKEIEAAGGGAAPSPEAMFKAATEETKPAKSGKGSRRR